MPHLPDIPATHRVETYVRHPDDKPGMRLAVCFELTVDRGRLAILRVIIEPANLPLPDELHDTLPSVSRLLLADRGPVVPMSVDELDLVGKLRPRLADALHEAVMFGTGAAVQLHDQPEEVRTAYERTARENVAKVVRRQRLDDDFLTKVTKLHAQGGWKAVAALYGGSERSIRRWLKEAKDRGLR